MHSPRTRFHTSTASVRNIVSNSSYSNCLRTTMRFDTAMGWMTRRGRNCDSSARDGSGKPWDVGACALYRQQWLGLPASRLEICHKKVLSLKMVIQLNLHSKTGCTVPGSAFIGHKNVVCLDRWSLVAASISLKCCTFSKKCVVFQDRWSLMAIVSRQISL